MQDLPGAPKSMEEVLHPGADADNVQTGFPDAPKGWRSENAIGMAQTESLELTVDHWEAIRTLQQYYTRHADGRINARELHDALDEKFHAKGGLRFLYELFPAGPVAQGCRLAGLKAPAGATDTGFGSVV